MSAAECLQQWQRNRGSPTTALAGPLPSAFECLGTSFMCSLQPPKLRPQPSSILPSRRKKGPTAWAKESQPAWKRPGKARSEQVGPVLPHKQHTICLMCHSPTKHARASHAQSHGPSTHSMSCVLTAANAPKPHPVVLLQEYLDLLVAAGNSNDPAERMKVRALPSRLGCWCLTVTATATVSDELVPG